MVGRTSGMVGGVSETVGRTPKMVDGVSETVGRTAEKVVVVSETVGRTSVRGEVSETASETVVGISETVGIMRDVIKGDLFVVPFSKCVVVVVVVVVVAVVVVVVVVVGDNVKVTFCGLDVTEGCTVEVDMEPKVIRTMI